MSTEFTPSDALALANQSGGGFGGDNGWWVVLLFFAFMNNGGFGNQRNVATSDDVQRATDFQALERQNNEGTAATRQAAYDVMGSLKDASYNNLSEIRELQNTVNNGFAANQKSMCELSHMVDSNKYEAALNTAQINANIASGNQKITDMIQQVNLDNERRYSRELERRLDKVETQNAINAATFNVVRYPVYATTVNPCNCGNNGY